MKTLENAKDLLLVLRIYANTVVLHGKQPLCLLLLSRYVNPRWGTAAIANRVSDQILKNLLYLKFVHAKAG